MLDYVDVKKVDKKFMTIRKFKTQVYLDKNPDNPYQGWYWVEIYNDIIEKFKIPTGFPETYNIACRSPDRRKYENGGNLPQRGRTATRKFTLNLDGELVALYGQKSITIKALITWLKTWVQSEKAKLITDTGKSYTVHEVNSRKQASFVYFIFNQDSNAIKIGQAKNVDRRLKTLQTSSPATLKLIKSVQVNGKKEATELEKSLHKKFEHIRLNGEWFRAVDELLKFIEEQVPL